VLRKLATGKSPEPAGWKACPTSPAPAAEGRNYESFNFWQSELLFLKKVHSVLRLGRQGALFKALFKVTVWVMEKCRGTLILRVGVGPYRCGALRSRNPRPGGKADAGKFRAQLGSVGIGTLGEFWISIYAGPAYINKLGKK
jgi:hypothetical protein